jgi:PAS domain S-box-containing protein
MEINKAYWTTMCNYVNNYKTLRRSQKNNYIIFFEAMLIGIFVSLIVEKLLWWRGVGAVHSILELTCVVFNMSLFFIVWNKYNDSPASSKVIAFGLLSTTIFDVIHIYYFRGLGFAVGPFRDLGAKFWILGRFAEIVTILAASFNYKKIGMNRWRSLVIASTIPLVISYVTIKYVEIFPALVTETGITDNKIISEFIVIIIAHISLIRHSRKINDTGYISYRYLLLAIMVIIPAELCFMLFKTYSSSIMVYGHVFRIIYCYFLHKSIFQSSVSYPYEQLERSQKRLSDILDALPIGILTFDNNLKLDFANKQYEALLSCKREHIIGLTNRELLEIFKRVDDEAIEPLAEMVIQGSKDVKNVIRNYLTGDGKPVKLQSDAEKIEDGVLLMLKDTRIEQEIDNLHLQTRAILNSMKSAAFICNNEHVILTVNKSFEELVGLSGERLMGMNLSELNQLVNYQRNEVNPGRYTYCSIDEQFESTLTSICGVKKKIITNRSDILNMYGEPIGKISVVTDITELKEQQERILHNEKLALLGQMGATIVHETRNFLTTIKGCSQLIESLANQDNVAEYARKINVNTDEVNRIISDFLSLSKPKHAIMEEVAVCDLLKSMEATLETSSLIKGIYIEFLYNIDERYVLCDEAQIRQVVLNICKNAIEAMAEVPNPKLIIEVGVSERNDNIYIKISDNGKGMDKEVLSKIGTLFFTTKQSGTGLGLSVCYNIVQGHGGWIDVASEEGMGTTFTINIPGIEDEELEEVLVAN